jgi:hypothetical protein
MLTFFILLLGSCTIVLAQGGPGLHWSATPQAGFAEFHGVLQVGDRLLAWGDSGADSVRNAQLWWLEDGNGDLSASWVDSRPRSRFWGGRSDSNGVLLVGEARRGGSGPRPLLMRLDSQGDSLWSREPDWGADCVLRTVAPLAQGGWIVGGERHEQALLARLDAQGDTLWTRDYEFFPSYEDVFYDVEELPDGRLVACGQTYHDWIEWTSRYAILGWFDAQGNLLDLFQPYDAQMFALEPLSDGRLAVTGDFQFAYLPVWLGTNSQDMTHRYFGVRERDMQATDIRECPDGGLAVGGRWQTAEGEMAALLLRLDAQGEELWRAAYDVCGIDMSWGLVSSPDGSHRLAGFCMPSRTAFVLKTQDESSPVLPAPGLHQESPWMASTTNGIQLRWMRPLGHGGRLDLYNAAGQRVARMALPSGATRVDWKLAGLASGFYLIQQTGAEGEAVWPLIWRP